MCCQPMSISNGVKILIILSFQMIIDNQNESLNLKHFLVIVKSRMIVIRIKGIAETPLRALCYHTGIRLSNIRNLSYPMLAGALFGGIMVILMLMLMLFQILAKAAKDIPPAKFQACQWWLDLCSSSILNCYFFALYFLQLGLMAFKDFKCNQIANSLFLLFSNHSSVLLIQSKIASVVCRVFNVNIK